MPSDAWQARRRSMCRSGQGSAAGCRWPVALTFSPTPRQMAYKVMAEITVSVQRACPGSRIHTPSAKHRQIHHTHGDRVNSLNHAQQSSQARAQGHELQRLQQLMPQHHYQGRHGAQHNPGDRPCSSRGRSRQRGQRVIMESCPPHTLTGDSKSMHCCTVPGRVQAVLLEKCIKGTEQAAET